jgi:hypothetical protein
MIVFVSPRAEAKLSSSLPSSSSSSSYGAGAYASTEQLLGGDMSEKLTDTGRKKKYEYSKATSDEKDENDGSNSSRSGRIQTKKVSQREDKDSFNDAEPSGSYSGTAADSGEKFSSRRDSSNISMGINSGSSNTGRHVTGRGPGPGTGTVSKNNHGSNHADVGGGPVLVLGPGTARSGGLGAGAKEEDHTDSSSIDASSPRSGSVVTATITGAGAVGTGAGTGIGGASGAYSQAPELTAQLIGWTRHKKVPEIKHALANGADVNIKDVAGNTPLIVACQNGHSSLCQYLVEQGANLNAANRKGNTALHYCFAFGFEDIANYLISQGADEYATNAEGLTCYEGLTRSDLDHL